MKETKSDDKSLLTTEQKTEMIAKELKALCSRLDNLEDKVEYIDRNVKKYGDDFCISTPIKGADGRITWKEKRLTEAEKRKLVGL